MNYIIIIIIIIIIMLQSTLVSIWSHDVCIQIQGTGHWTLVPSPWSAYSA